MPALFCFEAWKWASARSGIFPRALGDTSTECDKCLKQKAPPKRGLPSGEQDCTFGALLLHLLASCRNQGTSCTRRVPDPPSDEVTVIWNGGTASGTARMPPVSVPMGSNGLPDAVRVGAPTGSLEVALTVSTRLPMLKVAVVTVTSSTSGLSRTVGSSPGAAAP